MKKRGIQLLLFFLLMSLPLSAYAVETKQEAPLSFEEASHSADAKSSEPSTLTSSQDPESVKREVSDLIETVAERDKRLASLHAQENIPPKEEVFSSKFAGVAEVRVYADKSTATIGDKIKLTIEADHEKSVKVQFISQENNLGGFTLKNSRRTPARKIGKDQIRESEIYTLETFTVGSYVIPPQTVEVILPDGKTGKLKTPEVFIEIKSVIQPGEKEVLRDIKPPLHLPGGFPLGTVLFGLSALIVLSGAGVWFFYYRKWQLEKLPPPLPPDEIALRELARIGLMNLLRKGQVKEYYYLVSSCLRRYLEDRFSFKAPEQTTEEFLSSIVAGDILKGHQINILKEYLRHCDLVKYAKLDPEETQANALIATTQKFIEETKPVEIATTLTPPSPIQGEGVQSDSEDKNKFPSLGGRGKGRGIQS